MEDNFKATSAGPLDPSLSSTSSFLYLRLAVTTCTLLRYQIAIYKEQKSTSFSQTLVGRVTMRNGNLQQKDVIFFL